MSEQIGISKMLDLIRAEYREMPCLSLTNPQMRRLWSLETVVCDALVDALVAARVLRKRQLAIRLGRPQSLKLRRREVSVVSLAAHRLPNEALH